MGKEIQRRLVTKTHNLSTANQDGKSGDKDTPSLSNHPQGGVAVVAVRDLQPAIDNNNKQIPLCPDTELLNLLDEIPSPDGPLGPDIHGAVAERWLSILKDGLTKEARLELLKKYPHVKNCETMKAPVLNPEVKLALNSTAIKKDTFQVLAQLKISASLSAIGALLTSVLQCRENKQPTDIDHTKLISGLNDAGKILTDLLHSISTSRRQVILMNVNPTAKRIADDSKIDTLLFGSNFSEALKSVETIEKSTKVISRSTTR
ncbi:uncharacterized protein LOC128667422 [Microplitis demolitor]|uniref:uncharacterized protein LOC128667422 n=1 Tax=Microplitis demolitor TaxID=69319 RepID=UPI00235B5DA6|nr:uncharacterized protein LOC128667422 [Microplitis demolitor]